MKIFCKVGNTNYYAQTTEEEFSRLKESVENLGNKLDTDIIEDENNVPVLLINGVIYK